MSLQATYELFDRSKDHFMKPHEMIQDSILLVIEDNLETLSKEEFDSLIMLYVEAELLAEEDDVRC